MTSVGGKDTFGRYQLLEKLGQGGMGVVYRAFDTVLERVVALKLVLTPEGLDPEMRERFFREARAAGHLSHKNIVTVYDLGEFDGKPYLAMEYLDGEDLQKRLARPEKMSLRRKIEVAIDLCEGVEFAHTHGVIHRDLKPANIYITESGGAKILDFGLARLMTSQLTQSNMLMGTLNYMSPEQVRGDRADQRSDVFSIGVVLYELLGGRTAFEGDSAASTLFKILQETPEPLRMVDASLPEPLVAIVEKAIAKLRDERYADVGALRQDLVAFRDQLILSGPITPLPSQIRSVSGVQPAPVPGQRSFPVAVVATAAAVIVIVLGTVWFLTSRPVPQVPAATEAVAPPPDPIGPRLKEAQQALDARDFSKAMNGADAVLVLDPANGEARRIASAARRGAVDDAVARGTRALQSGDTPEAIKAAGDALAIAPDNPDARRILERVATRSSAADAEAARRRLADARKAAAAPARSNTPPAPTAEPRQPPASTSAPIVPQAPVSSATTEAVQPPAQAAIPAPTPPPQPAAPVSTTPAPQPAAPAPQPTAPPPSAPAEPVPTAEERVVELLGRYKQALEARDLDQLKRWWPSLGGSSENAIRQEFQHAARISVVIEEPHITITGNTGKVSFVRRYSVVTVEGRPLQSTTRASMDVRRSGNTWVIDSLRFTAQ